MVFNTIESLTKLVYLIFFPTTLALTFVIKIYIKIKLNSTSYRFILFFFSFEAKRLVLSMLWSLKD